MYDFTPWIRILTAVSVCILFAVLATIITEKAGLNHKQMQSRTARPMLVLGAIINVCVLIVILMLLRFVDNRSIYDLGLFISRKDLIFSITGSVILITFALAFIGTLSYLNGFNIDIQKPVRNLRETINLGQTLFVLLFVAIQEEVLFRGYITLNLMSYGPATVIITSTLLFAAVHLLTNRANLYQMLSWILGGVILTYAYLASGTIWVPVILHFIIDLINVLIFNITGKLSIFTIKPSITPQKSIFYRLAYSIALLIMLIVFYQPASNML